VKIIASQRWGVLTHSVECGPMPNVMAALGLLMTPSFETDEKRTFRNSIPYTTPQSLADAHCSSAVS